jgi:translation initiation factor IF-2
MSETDEGGTRSKAGASGGKTLSLKRTETSTVRQSFSHGRSKAVVVEKKRARVMPGGKPLEPEKPTKHTLAEDHPVVEARDVDRRASSARGGVVLRELTEDEKEARLRALTDAKFAEEEARKRAEQDASKRAVEEDRFRREREAAEKRKAVEEARKAAEEDARRRAEQEAARRLEKKEAETTTTTAAAPAALTPKRGRDLAEEEEEVSAKKGKAPVKTPAPRKAAPGGRRAGKLTITRALSGDEERMRSVASFRRQLNRAHRQQEAPPPAGPREVIIPETITVSELANRMARRGVDVIKVLMKSGMMLTVNDVIDADTAELVATELGHSVKRVAESDVLEGLRGVTDSPEELVPRAPIVTVMGHVDHGKTWLLDALRRSDVAAREAGGITQHIGAYQVDSPRGQDHLLDTPGHAAFTAMRARGAKVTDIVILVVAADDGVMPQTVEAIAHAKAARVPIIVAINKVDKGDANPLRVKTELLQHEIQVEELGGDVLAVEVSAIKGIGLEKLEEAILLQSEVLDLRSNPNRPADGAVIEAKLDKGRGPVATVLVERGTLKHGDLVVAGAEWGRVRALVNERGETVEQALPAEPVELLGLSGVPEAGDEFVVVESEARAREVTEYRGRKRRESRQATISRQSLDQLLKVRKEGEKRLLPLVIKTDVQGSLEAIEGALLKGGSDEVGVQVLHGGVGGITESDVILAHASGAAIIGFNVRANVQARDRSKRDGVDIRYYNIIYNVLDDVKAALSGMLAPETRERFLGNAEILEVFNISKVGKVAGCRVTDGLVRRGAKVRLIRDDVVIHEGDLSTLKRFKDEVREVQVGQECGMAFANFQDIQKGDVIECYEVETIRRTL